MKKAKNTTDANGSSYADGFFPGILLDELDDLLIVLDRDFNVLFVNKACLISLGYSAWDLSDTPFTHLEETGCQETFYFSLKKEKKTDDTENC